MSFTIGVSVLFQIKANPVNHITDQHFISLWKALTDKMCTTFGWHFLQWNIKPQRAKQFVVRKQCMNLPALYTGASSKLFWSVPVCVHSIVCSCDWNCNAVETLFTVLILLHSERPKLHRVLAILSAKGLTKRDPYEQNVNLFAYEERPLYY